MPIYTSPFFWYDKAIKTITLADLSTDDIKIALLTSLYTVNAATHEFYTDLTNELPTLDGYTLGGFSLITKTLTEPLAGKWKFASDDVKWSVTGSGLTAHFWVLYNNTKAGKPLYGYSYLNYNSGSPLDVITPNLTDLDILLPADGWLFGQKVNGA